MRTLFDLVTRILDSRDGYDDPINERRAIRSAIWGYEQVAIRHRWASYTTAGIVQVKAPVELTASISDTGVVTVTAGTIPSWIESGSLYVSNRFQPVEKSLTASTFSLYDYAGPAVASGTVRLVNDRVFLSDRVRELFAVRNERTRADLLFSNPQQFRSIQVLDDMAISEPTLVTIVQTETVRNARTELRFTPAPSADTTFRVDYYRMQRPAAISHDCIEVFIDSVTSIATIGEKLNSLGMRTASLGKLLLIVSEDELRPDPDHGFTLAGGGISSEEYQVNEVTSSSTMTIKETLTANVEGRGAVLTHVLDLPPNTAEAAAMYGEAKYMQIGQGSPGDFWQMMKMADAEMLYALESEGILSRNQTPPRYRTSTYQTPEQIVME